MRRLAHRMVDDMLTYLETVRERPVGSPFRRKWIPREPALPQEGQGAEQVLQEFVQNILPYPCATSTRAFGAVHGQWHRAGALADFLRQHDPT